MRVIGIDPGLATTGIGLVEGDEHGEIRCLDWCTITTPAGLATPDRLLELSRDLKTYMDEHRPSLAVVERIFFSVNERTAVDVAQARGVILAAIAEKSLPILEPTPPQLKSCITGDGKADKRQMQDMLARMFKLPSIPKPDDAADALAMAVFGALQEHASIATR
ncbi:MAG: crossover junction endodeoxyribonuclease RuvC [Candidatus Peribacteraceae bacterium]|nr:crossover junction endodeoxyribonuclease RuvC [Candidatus Peribacteraceae bacterium]